MICVNPNKVNQNIRVTSILAFILAFAACDKIEGRPTECNPLSGGSNLSGTESTPPVNVPTDECAEGQSEFASKGNSIGLTTAISPTISSAIPPTGEGPVALAAPPPEGIHIDGEGFTLSAPPISSNMLPRLIEESDIVKLVGRTLYVLNTWRGLQIIDLTEIANPRLLCRQPLQGYPIEMYIKNGRALVVVSSDTSAPEKTAETVSITRFHGSQIRIINVTSCDNLAIEGGIDLEGDVTDTRLVGDILYAVTAQFGYGYGYAVPFQVAGGTAAVTSTLVADGTTSAASVNIAGPTTTVTSINVADPKNIIKVQSLDFPSQGYNHHIHVTEKAIVIAGTHFGVLCEPTGPAGTCAETIPKTKFQLVDIGNPDGRISLVTEWTASGYLQDRWGMDAYNGFFRVITAGGYFNSFPILTTFTFDGTANVKKLAELTLALPRPESLTAVRFDGNRAYAVTFERRDPLITLDLSDPAHPKQGGMLDVPGWSDFIEPRGDRLIALGHDWDPATASWGLQVSLFDVSNLQNPTMLQRVTFGGGWGFTPGGRDDFQKVFKVLDTLGLIMVPFRSYSQDATTPYSYQSGDGIQLIDFTHDTLTKRGLTNSKGAVQRALTLDDNILSLSDTHFQIFNATDRDHPRLVATFELAVNIMDMVIPASGEYGVLLTGDYFQQETQLRVVPLSSKLSPDEATPYSVTTLSGNDGLLFQNGEFIYYLSLTPDRKGVIQVIDLSDPKTPRIRGVLTLDPQSYGYSNYWGLDSEITQVDGSLLVTSIFSGPVSTCVAEICTVSSSPISSCIGDICTVTQGTSPIYNPSRDFVVLDLSDPDHPRLGSRVDIKSYTGIDKLHSRGRIVYFSANISSPDISRNYLVRLDLSDSANPIKLPDVNIPGRLVDVSQDGRYLYSLESRYETNRATSVLSASALVGDRAYLRDQIELSGDVYDLIYDTQGTIYFTNVTYIQSSYDLGRPNLTLNAVNVRDPRDIKISSSITLQNTYGFLGKLVQGKALVDIGYGHGLAIFNIAEPTLLSLNQFAQTQGWIQNILINGPKAYIVSGYYGVQVIDIQP